MSFGRRLIDTSRPHTARYRSPLHYLFLQTVSEIVVEETSHPSASWSAKTAIRTSSCMEDNAPDSSKAPPVFRNSRGRSPPTASTSIHWSLLTSETYTPELLIVACIPGRVWRPRYCNPSSSCLSMKEVESGVANLLAASLVFESTGVDEERDSDGNEIQGVRDSHHNDEKYRFCAYDAE